MNNSNSRPSRCVMVTGAGSGIGNAVTSRLLKEGYMVFGGAINEQEALKLSHQFGANFEPILLDVRHEASVQEAAVKVGQLRKNIPLVALFNIAGVIVNGPLADLTAEQFQQVLSVNLVGIHNVSRAFLNQLSSHKGSRIINMSSASGSRTMPFAGAYSASKFGVEALSAAMRMEFAALGISVSVIAPGLINTPMADKIKAELGKDSSLSIYREPLKRFLDQTMNASRRGIPIEHVVDVICGVLLAKRPMERYEIHNNYLRDVLVLRALPVRLRESLVKRMLKL